MLSDNTKLFFLSTVILVSETKITIKLEGCTEEIVWWR